MLHAKGCLHPSSAVRVKITGDGTQISRNLHTVVVAFTVIEKRANPTSSHGNHTVAILNVNEQYEDLAEGLRDIRNEIKQLKGVTVDNVEYSIEFFLGAVWKYLALCTGIGAANSKFLCIWCKCPSNEKHDLSLSWSCIDTTKGARTIEEIHKLVSAPKKLELERYGCQREPLFPTTPIDHIVLDVLHLFL